MPKSGFSSQSRAILLGTFDGFGEGELGVDLVTEGELEEVDDMIESLSLFGSGEGLEDDARVRTTKF